MKSYLQGTWYAVLGDTVTVLLPPAERGRVAATWDLVDAGAGAPEVLDLLLAGGLSPLSGFALVVREGEGVRVLARGNVRVQLATADGVVVADGTGAMTWVDQQADAVTGVVVEMDSEVLDPTELVVGTGLVRVARLSDPATPPPAPAAAPVAVEPVVEPVAPVVETVAEPVVEPVVEAAPVVQLAPEPVAAEPVVPAAYVPAEPEPQPEPEPEPQPELADLPTETFAAVEADLPPSAPAFDVSDIDTGDPLGIGPIPSAPTFGTPVPAPEVQGWGGAPLGGPDPLGQSGPFAGAPEPYEDHDGRTHSGLVHDVVPPPTGIPGQPQAPAVTAQPVARLVLSTGDTIDVDRAILFGRAPEARRFQVGEEPRLVTVPSPHQEISSTHLEVRPGSGADHGAAVVSDLGSTNGTVVVQPGMEPEELHAGIAVQLLPGAIIDLGDGVTIHVTAP